MGSLLSDGANGRDPNELLPVSVRAGADEPAEKPKDPAEPPPDTTNGTAGCTGPPPSLLPHHAQLIRDSAISDEVAADRGYRTVTTKAELSRLGFSDKQCRVPALLVPVWGVNGEIATYQIRPDEPRIVDGKAVKYETPRGTRMVLDVPPRARPWLRDPKRSLIITEGARKADAAVTAGHCAIAVLGVWNWRGTNELGGTTALADWDSIALNGRDVYLVFDSDVITKPQVHAALARLKAFLESRTAVVRIAYLSSGEGGAKVGLDDFIGAGGRVERLLECAETNLRPPPGGQPAQQAVYFVHAGSTYWNKPSREGVVPVQLANFIAGIVADVSVSDGLETTRAFEIDVHIGERVTRCQVPARSFPALNWVTEQVGVLAIVSPGIGARDHLRAAIQTLSGDVPTKTVYAHTGWRDVPGQGWLYLNGGGAIGPNGPVPEVNVSLPDALRAMVLPAPPTGTQIADCVRATLDLLRLAPDRLSYPLVAMAFRAVMGDTEYSVYSVGTSDAFKTEFAALIQSFFGAGFTARNLPCSWSSTANFIEMLAFKAKDAAIVVDDLAPTGSKADSQRLFAIADRVFRGQGNRAGRGRLTADGELREGKAPRGTILATGEDLPPGYSMRARILVLEFGKGDVKSAALTECQAHAASGKFASTMAAFVQWVAAAYPEHKAKLHARALELRQTAQRNDRHRRTASIISDLQAGFELFLDFGVNRGAIAAHESEELKKRSWAALCAQAESQSSHLRATDPASLFIRLLGSALAAGKAHVAGPTGETPPGAEVLGWRRITTGQAVGASNQFQSQGIRVGWVDGTNLYLDPDAALKAAQEMADDASRISVSVDTLGKRLFERGLLLSTETEKNGNRRYRVRPTLEGIRRRAFHVALSVFVGPGQSGQSDQDAPEEAADGDARPADWTGGEQGGPATGPQGRATLTVQTGEGYGVGPTGPVGPVAQPPTPAESTEDGSVDRSGLNQSGDGSDDSKPPDTPPTSLYDDRDPSWEH